MGHLEVLAILEILVLNVVELVGLGGHRKGRRGPDFIDSIHIERCLVMAQVPNRVPVVSRCSIVVCRSAIVSLLWVVRTVIDVLGHVVRNLRLGQIRD